MNQRNPGIIYRRGVINASSMKLPTALILQSMRASVTEWFADPNRWSRQLARHMRERQAVKFDIFITWRLASSRGNSCIKHDPLHIKDMTTISFPLFGNGIAEGYYADREQKTCLELLLHSLDSLDLFERIASTHLSPLVELSGASRALESSTPGHAMIKRWSLGGIHPPRNAQHQAWVTRGSYQ